MTEEHKIQDEIRLALSDTCMIFRANVGTGCTKDGRYFSTGLPKGFSDLFGHRKSDGRAFYIEVKTTKGRLSKEQANFLDKMRKSNAIAGVCRSVEEAINLINGGK